MKKKPDRTEELLYPGALVVVGPSPATNCKLIQLNTSTDPAFREMPRVIPEKAQPLTADGLASLEAELYAPKDQRKRLRGVYVDLFLERESTKPFFDLLAWLVHRYPRTPVVAHTDAHATLIQRACAAQERTQTPERWFIPKEALSSDRLAELLPFEARQALVGLIRYDLRTVAVIDRRRLVESQSVARYFEATFFGPFDAAVLGVRRYLLDVAGPERESVRERHLRTLDAHFEGVPFADLKEARGLTGSFYGHGAELRSIFGSELDKLRKRFELARNGIGERMWAPDPLARLLATRRRLVRRPLVS